MIFVLPSPEPLGGNELLHLRWLCHRLCPSPLHARDHCCVSGADYLAGELSWEMSKSCLGVGSLYEDMSILLGSVKLAAAEQRLQTEQPCSAKLNSLNVLRGSA